MFGRKSRKIRELDVVIRDKNEELARFRREARELREKITGLTADRDNARKSIELSEISLREKIKEVMDLTGARQSLDQLQNDFKILGSNHENRGRMLEDLTTQRDQFAKRVEELEEANRERQKNVVQLLPTEDNLDGVAG